MLKSTKTPGSGQLNSRPRRFSLLYSSSDEDEEYDSDILKQRRKSKSISKSMKPDIKMTALRNKLKLLQKVNNSENIDNGLQSNVKKRNNLSINISNSSSSESFSDSDDESPQKPLGSNIKLNNAEPNQTSKKPETTSDELNEDDLIKAIESESDAEKQQMDDDYLDIDLDQNFDEFIAKQSNKDSNEIFTNVAIDSLDQSQAPLAASKSNTNVFVPHEDDDEDENDPDMHLMLQADHVDKEEESDEDYDEMLLEAALLTDSENNRHNMISVSNNTSDNDVFMNVDDLDPHSFYFEDQEDSDLDKTNKHVIDLDFDTRVPDKEPKKSAQRDVKNNNYHHSAFFQDEESTDEEDTLPAISKKIKTRTRSFHNSHDAHLGKALPKLNFWKTDNKRPFSIIDGLSTKSLFSITIVDDSKDGGAGMMTQNLLTPAAKVANSTNTPKIKVNIHEKLMAEASSLDNTPRPKDATKEDFPVDQLLAISSGSEQEHDFVDSSATNSDVDIPKPQNVEAGEISMIIHQDNNGENDLFTKDGMESLINNELIIEIPSEMNFHPLEQFRRNSVSELQPHLASLDSFYHSSDHKRGSLAKDRFRNNSVMDTSDLELIQKLTKNSDLQHANTNDMKRKESIIMDEAKLEKLRYTKSGLFSEAAINSLEEFVHSNTSKSTKNRRYSTNQVPKSNNGSNVAFEIDNFTF